MNAEIITVGSELLLFPRSNVGADYINNKLAELGIKVIYRTRVGDEKEHIVEAIKTATERTDLIITIGGLSIAKNDLTREALSQSIGKKLCIDKKLLDRIRKKFESRSISLPEGVERIAMLPEGAECLENKAGIIPAIFLKLKKSLIVSMPGSMREIESIMEFSFIPKIKKFIKDIIFYKKIYHLIGITELDVESRVKELFGKAGCSFTIHSSSGVIDLNLLIEGEDSTQIEKTVSEIDEEVKHRLGMDIFGEDGDTLESVIGKMLMGEKLTLSVAESCTGGLLSQRITNIPGSSKYFKGGMVCYTNEAKEKLLGIPMKEIEEFGAISEEMAKSMAEHVRRKMDSDYSISVTGIAGPEGGTVDKPIGLVFIAIDDKENVQVEKLTLSGDRFLIRNLAVQRSFDLLRRKLLLLKERK